MSKELEVRNLQISFKTNNGTVKAVRDISFDVDKGETLCIVGESGSGKSVTAKAMLGILAGNSIVEGGEIIYNGQDLLKYTEDDFNKIRGNKVTMIFQDPMSSLDPIMKIGKQMTEATILNGKTNRKNAKKDFAVKIKQLKEAMIEAGIDASKVNAQVQEFEKFVKLGSELKMSYNQAHEYVDSAILTISQLLIDIIQSDEKTMKEEFKELNVKLDKVYDTFVIDRENAEFAKLRANFNSVLESYTGGNSKEVRDALEAVKNYLEIVYKKEEPNFFTMGYYAMSNDVKPLAKEPVEKVNAMLRENVDKNFMLEFIENIAKALESAQKKVIPAKQYVVEKLKEARADFEKENLEKSVCEKWAKSLSQDVDKSIDKLSLHKNTFAYTFKSTIDNEIKRYFEGVKKNPGELKRVEKQTAKREELLKKKKGSVPQVVPAVLVDLELTKKNIIRAIDKLAESYEAELSDSGSANFSNLAVDMIDYLKSLSFAMVNKITKQMAYDKAIRIMEDVGIKEPRKRFEQYPFEFSGGMRQRIVIAIAIAANPDILICDEPTTALDVTIQAQILELINDIKKKRNISVIFITHDLGVVANMADKVAVMYAGKVVEYGTVNDIFYHPAHPYTWALLSSMPDLDTKEKLEAIPGTPPNMIYPPVGDAFAERNKYAMQIDFEKQPPMFKISDTHSAATWLLHPNAPKVEPPKAVTDRIERMKKELEAASNE